MPDKLPATEAANPRSVGLDTLPLQQLVELLVDENRYAVDAVFAESENIAQAVEEIVARLQRGGRLHYVGAGTSGRIAYLDASEIPPTFGVPRDLVCAHIAGGERALTQAVEGAEDDIQAGSDAMGNATIQHVTPGDAVIGISASGGAQYVLGALKKAREIGAYTIAICNNKGSQIAGIAETSIVLSTGAEVLTGSTRLKAGTAQKIVLNAISTAVMVRLGKVHGNLMVDVITTNEKLRARAIRLVMEIRKCSEQEARRLLAENGWSVRACMQ